MITYRKGDATEPIENGKVMIAHVNNSAGAWGAGFVLPLGHKFPNAKELYLAWYDVGSYRSGKNIINFELGEILIVKAKENLYIANMIAQKDFGFMGLRPFRPDSFEECLMKLNIILVNNNFDYLVGPRMGSGLSGESWEVVSSILEKRISIPIVIYDRPEDNWPNTVYEEN